MSEPLGSCVGSPRYLGIVLYNIINTQRHTFFCKNVPLWKQNVKTCVCIVRMCALEIPTHLTIINLVASSLGRGIHNKLPNALRKAG